MTAAGAAPEIGRTYEVVIGEEIDTQWTGPLGIATIGEVRVVVPTARRGDRLTVRVTGVALDPWTKRPEARFEILQSQGSLGESQGSLGESQGSLGESQGSLGESQGSLRES